MTKLTRTFETVEIKSSKTMYSDAVKLEMTISHHTANVNFTTKNQEGLFFNCSLEKAQNIARALNAGLKYAKKSMGRVEEQK